MRFLSCGVLMLTACTHGHHTSKHAFDDAEAWAQAFEDPARDDWQKPDEVMAALALAPTLTVADIGSATGYFPIRFAKQVNRVYGVDIESAMVEYLQRRAEREGVANLTAIQASSDDAKIPEPVDLITIVDTYHHLENRPAYFTALKRSLKPTGRVAIIDFTPSSKRGPPAAAKVAPQAVIDELKQAGFSLDTEHTFLADQYFLIFSVK